MEYTVFLTQERNAQWRATIPDLPHCEVSAVTRADALEKIKLLADTYVRHSERVRIEVPDPLGPINGKSSQPNLKSLGYGQFKDDPTWSHLFDEIEHKRDQHMIENS